MPQGKIIVSGENVQFLSNLVVYFSIFALWIFQRLLIQDQITNHQTIRSFGGYPKTPGGWFLNVEVGRN